MNLIRDFNFSSAIGNFYQSAQTFASNLTDQQKRVAMVATAAIAFFAIGYCIYKRCTFKASEEAPKLHTVQTKDTSVDSSEEKKDARKIAPVVLSMPLELSESEGNADGKADGKAPLDDEGTADAAFSELKRVVKDTAGGDRSLETALAEGKEETDGRGHKVSARATSSESIADEEPIYGKDPKTPSRNVMKKKIKKLSQNIEELGAKAATNLSDIDAHEKLKQAIVFRVN